MFAEAVRKCSTGRGGSNNGITCRAQDFAAGAWTIGWHDQEKNQSAPSGLETSGIIPIGNGSIQDLQQRGPRGSRLIGQPSLARASSLGRSTSFNPNLTKLRASLLRRDHDWGEARCLYKARTRNSRMRKSTSCSETSSSNPHRLHQSRG